MFPIKTKFMKGILRKNTNSVNVTMDLSNWMSNLDNIKRDTPINLLAIPGSHDSMTYEISRQSAISPDAEPIVKQLAKYLKPLVKLFMFKWSVTQNKNVHEQLDLGIRYLDLRIATKENDLDFYFVHGMYGGNIKTGLNEIRDFLKEHIKETVILDFQHFYDFNQSDHERLIALLKNIFGDSLCPRSSNISSVTLNWMEDNKYQVIAIYRNSFASDIQFLWTSNMWPTPWPNTIDVYELLKILKDNLGNRSYNKGYVSQCVLTPQKSTVIMNPFCGVKQKCAKPVSNVIFPWIQKQTPPINIAIADFIDMNAAMFPLSIISLNYIY